MRIILCAFDEPLENAWKAALSDCQAEVEQGGHSLTVQRGDITKLHVAAVVSPANSYGYMRGGVDLAYTKRFGPGVEHALRAAIATLPEGYLPIGQALAVATGDARIPYLVSAPTMKTPQRLNGPETVIAASRAAVRCALEQGYESLAFPGMGTGTGGLDTAVAARGMLQGICEGLRH
ncbi:conserved hypothetical protein [uncultured delta proteobacterium]|uniref:Macro domain-containing protein n=1 Tax=uncultured delta proteobacterium TaxID=34034 RepID=A0A212IVV2_9DELT|nr:conserved hypothetical protein [uncultured delta proteobacterium]